MKRFIAPFVIAIALATASVAAAGNGYGHHRGIGHHHFGLVCTADGQTILVLNVYKYLLYHEDATAGACQAEEPTPVEASAAQVNRASGCASGSAYRVGDQSSGWFVDVTGEQLLAGHFTDGLDKTWNVVPANWIKGVGASCDNPLLQGYKYSGFKVDDSGTVNQAAPQFNIYPFYTK